MELDNKHTISAARPKPPARDSCVEESKVSCTHFADVGRVRCSALFAAAIPLCLTLLLDQGGVFVSSHFARKTLVVDS